LENYSGYDAGDLRRLVEAGAKAMRASHKLHVVVTPTPQRTRGCAEVGGKKVVLAVAPPSRFSKPKLARILKHELLHTQGLEHEDMTDEELWSKGPEPRWARDKQVRHERKGKAIQKRLR
jgi:hypothetical protein